MSYRTLQMPEQEMQPKQKHMTVGWRETISMPALGLNGFRAKLDTGALTTALHATQISRRVIDGKPWVEFLPDHEDLEGSDYCLLPLLHSRMIKNTSGIPEARFIVATTLEIGDRKGRVEVSLTDRSDMKYPIIIGRSAMRLLRLTVDPSRSWLQSKRTADRRKTKG